MIGTLSDEQHGILYAGSGKPGFVILTDLPGPLAWKKVGNDSDDQREEGTFGNGMHTELPGVK